MRRLVLYTKRGTCVLGAVWCLCVPCGVSQTAPSVEAGSRVRISLAGPGPGHVTGTVLAVGSDSLSLAGARGDTIAVALHSIRRLELSKGRRSAGGGALRGGLLGASLGALAVLGVTLADGCFSGSFDPFSSNYSGGHCPSAGTAWGLMLGGGAIGAAVGVVGRGERWVRVPLDKARISIEPRGIRVEIGF